VDEIDAKKLATMLDQAPPNWTVDDWREFAQSTVRSAICWQRQADEMRAERDIWRWSSPVSSLSLTSIPPLKRKRGRPRKATYKPIRGLLSMPEPEPPATKPKKGGRPRKTSDEEEQNLMEMIEEFRRDLTGQLDREVTDKQFFEAIFFGVPELGIEGRFPKMAAHRKRGQVEYLRKYYSRIRKRQSQNPIK
jgi:hypothetical protein